MKKALFVSVGLCVGMLTTGSAMADAHYSVSVKKSDFHSEETVQALHKRIQKQAKAACPKYFVSRNLREIANCRAEVEADLVSRINHPLLNAYVEGEESLRVALAERRRGGRS